MFKRAKTSADNTATSIQVVLPASVSVEDTSALRFHGRRLVPATDNVSLTFTAILADDTELTGSVYDLKGSQANTSPTLSITSALNNAGMIFGDVGSGTDEGLDIKLDLMSPNGTQNRKVFAAVLYKDRAGTASDHQAQHLAVGFDTTQRIKGLKVASSSGNIESGDLEVWAAVDGGDPITASTRPVSWEIARMELSTDLTGQDFATADKDIAWDQESSQSPDLYGGHSTSSQTERYTITQALLNSGTTKIRFKVFVRISAISDATRMRIAILKNGAGFLEGSGASATEVAGVAWAYFETPDIELTLSDYFTVTMRVEGDSSITVASNRSFYVVERVD